MRKKYLIVFLGLFLLGSCTNKADRPARKIYIVATTGMLADALKNIVGDSAEVEAIMGPGVDPHLYKATQGDLRKLLDADLIFYSGLHLEGKMGEVLKKLGRTKPVIGTAEELDRDLLLSAQDYGQAYDPHVWFDVSLWKQVVEITAGELIDHAAGPDSACADYYRKNALAYEKQLDSLHRATLKSLQLIPKSRRVMITAHDAFSYFGRAYDIEVKGLQGISTMSEFGLRDVSDLVNLIVSRDIQAVFVETSVSDKAISAVVEGVRKKGHSVRIGGSLYSDAMGAAGTPEGTYIGMIDHNVRTIVESLK